MEAKIRWLSEEWQPMFQQRKQEVQAQRLDAEERVRREKAAEEDRKNYECGGMEAEDAATICPAMFLFSFGSVGLTRCGGRLCLGVWSWKPQISLLDWLAFFAVCGVFLA
ncbi:unnamed protein product [Durusdinium trenchii]|uniref:Uncharacterized protein n=1 Tax=Durusdinium trenchii TaxID=1381693 RepID=A0ABP0HQQ8_9DINO